MGKIGTKLPSGEWVSGFGGNYHNFPITSLVAPQNQVLSVLPINQSTQNQCIQSSPRILCNDEWNRDDPVTAHMMEAKDCLSKWTKPALVMFSTGWHLLIWYQTHLWSCASRDPVTRGQDKVFLKLIPHAKEKARLHYVGKERKL